MVSFCYNICLIALDGRTVWCWEISVQPRFVAGNDSSLSTNYSTNEIMADRTDKNKWITLKIFYIYNIKNMTKSTNSMDPHDH